MSNLIDSWFAMYEDKYGSTEEAIDYFNNTCGMRLRKSEFTEYQNKKRRPSLCMEWIMRCDIMMDELKKAGWKRVNTQLKGDELKTLITAITLPQELDRKKNGERRR